MKYLTADELLKKNKEEAHEILENCTGKSIRDNFAIKIFGKYLADFFGADKTVRVLDLASASGGFVRQASGLGYNNIFGVDLDDYLQDNNRGLFKEFKMADLSWQPIPWPDQFFNIVTAWCVLPHLENPFHCAREIHRILSKGGLFIFTAPYLASKPSTDYFIKHEDFGSYRASNNHLVLFPRGVVAKSILKYFDLIDVEYHFRTKIFYKGLRGKLRHIIFNISKKIHPDLPKKIARRWAYNIVYILRKK